MSKDKILVVEDDPLLLPGYRRTLSEEGYEVVAVNSGVTALDLIKKNTYNLILTDIVMEGITGLQLLKEIREVFVSTPVILITGYSSLNVAEEAIQNQATDYLVKPCKKEELKERVAKALNNARLEKLQKLSACIENTQEVLEMFAKNFEVPISNISQYSRLLLDDLETYGDSESNFPAKHTCRQIEAWLKNIAETVYEMKHFNKSFDIDEYNKYYSRLLDIYRASRNDYLDDQL